MENNNQVSSLTKKESRENFLKAAKTAREKLYFLLLSYEKLNDDDNSSTAENYPFEGSYDEWLCEYDNWIETLENNWFPERRTFYPTITVGDLKTMFENVDDDTQICIWDEKSAWWLNISSLTFPDQKDTFTIVLNPKDNFDTRQF